MILTFGSTEGRRDGAEFLQESSLRRIVVARIPQTFWKSRPSAPPSIEPKRGRLGPSASGSASFPDRFSGPDILAAGTLRRVGKVGAKECAGGARLEGRRRRRNREIAGARNFEGVKRHDRGERT